MVLLVTFRLLSTILRRAARRICPAHLIETEILGPLASAKAALLDVREDAVLPDALDGGLVEVLLHEVARPDGGVPVIQLCVSAVNCANNAVG